MNETRTAVIRLIALALCMGFLVVANADELEDYSSSETADKVRTGFLSAGFATRTDLAIEVATLAIMAVDTAQTVTIARNPGCFREANPVASAIYGSDHPSEASVLVVGAATMFLHYHASQWLSQKASNSGGWKVAQKVFQFGYLVGHTGAVMGNERIGLKPFGGSNLCQ